MASRHREAARLFYLPTDSLPGRPEQVMPTGNRVLISHGNQEYSLLMHLKQKHRHLQVVLSIGGGAAAETFPYVAASSLARDNFARSARGLVDASGLDGIDSRLTQWQRHCPAAK